MAAAARETAAAAEAAAAAAAATEAAEADGKKDGDDLGKELGKGDGKETLPNQTANGVGDDFEDLESFFTDTEEAGDGNAMELDRKSDETVQDHRRRIGRLAKEQMQRRRDKGGRAQRQSNPYEEGERRQWRCKGTQRGWATWYQHQGERRHRIPWSVGDVQHDYHRGCGAEHRRR